MYPAHTFLSRTEKLLRKTGHTCLFLMGFGLVGMCKVLPCEAANVIMQEALQELNKAVQTYQMGDRSTAIQTLLSILEEEGYPKSIQQEARIYIAEIMLSEGNPSGAQDYLIEVLQINPNYTIDRFRHPPEICAEFDIVNAQWRQRTNPIESLNEPQNWQRFVPFGVYHLQNNLQWKGLLYGGLQLTMGVSSLLLFNYLQQHPGYNQNDPDEQARLERILTIQRASTLGFYAIWATASLDAHRDWAPTQTESSSRND